MTERSGKAREISLGSDFGDVAVTVNGVRVEVHTNGSILAYTNRSVDAPQVGDKRPDGSVYAGISPDTNKPMYATPADAPLTYTFNQAQKYAARLDAHGHQDWRVPAKSELNVLYNNRAAIGGFDESGLNPAGWYWSSLQVSGNYAGDQRFSDGYQGHDLKSTASSLRCVR